MWYTVIFDPSEDGPLTLIVEGDNPVDAADKAHDCASSTLGEKGRSIVALIEGQHENLIEKLVKETRHERA